MTDAIRPTFRGGAVASSDGIVIGHIQKLATGRHPIPERAIEHTDIPSELQRLDSALQKALKELDEEQEHLIGLTSQEPLLVLEAHRMMLLDPEFIKKVRQLIQDKQINAEWALRQQLDAIGLIFDEIENPYLREKKSDVEQVGIRIMRQLMGQSLKLELPSSSQPQILLGQEFTPQDIVTLWRLGIAGIIAEQGGMNAHSIIIARGIGLPALIGSDDILDKAEDGDAIILDARLDKWILNPTEQDMEQYRNFIAALEVIRAGLEQFADKPSLSRDGKALPIMANLEFKEELRQTHQVGAEGIGLFRTEFAFLQSRDLPGHHTQHQHYKHIIRAMKGAPVTFRLLDIGGDKPDIFRQLSGYRYGGANPAMGLRGVRLLLHLPDLLKHQLTALIKAAEEGPLNILVPMVTSVEEMEQVRDMVEACKHELGVTGHIPLGAMIEVPAAVMIARELAAVSDFFSIGTNDLIQYTLAADRGDEDVGALYRPDHPAICQFIKMSVQAAREAGIPVSVCGELAADPDWTQTFLNMGMDSLSMGLNSILKIRQHLSHLKYRPDAG
ncbi:MAG: phosphoenolpyruvate--protein phosphotransferase [Mariprofundaceae bacterium]|nr:phosphoenolpyruvate--protein phosphotransferase [Mariprofundaceae bacterium]